MKHWKTWKLAHAYPTIGSGTTPTSTIEDYYSSEEGIPWVTTSELRENYIDSTAVKITEDALKSFSALRIYDPGSLMIAMYGATIGRLGITTVPATCNQACCVFEKSEQFDNRFLFYWLWHRRADLIALSTGGGQPNLSQQDLREERALCPPLQTQRLIAQFLDQKTAQIDGLIEKKRALLQRLSEKRQALITQAVTKGLNPKVPMKPSGIEWLGDIPAHWEVKRLSFVSNVIDCKHRTPEYIDEGIPLVSTSEIKPYVIDYMTKRQVSDEEFATMSEGGRAPVQGDIIYSRNVSVGSAVKVRVDQVLCLGQDLCIVRPNEVNADFLEHFLNSWACLEQLNSEVVGATFKRVNVDVIKKYFLLLPPEQEQKDICAYLEKVLKEELKKEEMVSQSMSLLVEYRAAIVTAAVTGQLREFL